MHEMQEMQVQPMGWEDPWSRKRHPIPVFLPGKFHLQRSMVGYCPRVSKSQTWLSDWACTQGWKSAVMTIKQSIEVSVGPALGQHRTTEISHGTKHELHVTLKFSSSHAKKSKMKQAKLILIIYIWLNISKIAFQHIINIKIINEMLLRFLYTKSLTPNVCFM